MTLRQSTLLYICVVFVVVLVASYLIAQHFLLGSFVRLEEGNVLENIECVVAAFDNRITSLEMTTSDWAFWDDTYFFVQNRNQDYIDKNLAPSTFESLQLYAIVITDTQGELMYSGAYDTQQDKEVAVPPALLQYITNSSLFIPPDDLDYTVSGIILLPGDVLIASSCPITDSAGTAPALGMFTMIGTVNAQDIEQLGEITKSTLSAFPSNSSQVPADIVKARRELSSEGPFYVSARDSETISGYALIHDINDNPALILRTEESRDIYNSGWDSVIFSLLMLLACAVIGIGAAIFLLEKLILSRVRNLGESVRQLSSSGDISARVKVTGKDELSALTEDINKMLDTIEKHEFEQAGLRRNLESEMTKRADYTRELAHELKTPITPIISSSELLTDGLKEQPWLNLAKNIYRGALDMNDRLDDLLDMAKGDVGILRLNLEDVDPMSLINQVAGEVSPLFKTRQQSLKVDLPPSLPHIMGDEVRLRQVLRNLLNNATKFTPEKGTITVRARQAENNLLVEVEDTGRGIDPEKICLIFQPYTRLSEDKEHQKGLGLGLKLSKTIIELHHGKIWVKSQRGKGSTFSFSIPIIQTP
ncbi:MAG: HAMP domain-containing protein [Dehalococcoidales bacterium]|nr:HAMP domain-containing protein [Dehalococcoidales bacterium]